MVLRGLSDEGNQFAANRKSKNILVAFSPNRETRIVVPARESIDS